MLYRQETALATTVVQPVVCVSGIKEATCSSFLPVSYFAQVGIWDRLKLLLRELPDERRFLSEGKLDK